MGLNMKKLILIGSLLLAGCSSWTKHVKVIHTTGEAEVKNVDINNGDTVLCDKNGCRVIHQN